MSFFRRLLSLSEKKKYDICPICYRDCSSETTKETGLCETCSCLIRNARFPDIPIQTEEYPIKDIWEITLSGTTHIHNGSDPQIQLKKTPCGSRVYFVPDMNNPVDQFAMKAFSIYDKYIGWYPRSSPVLQQKLYEHIQNHQPYWAIISNIYTQNNLLFCVVKIYIFETEEDKKKRLEELEHLNQKAKSDVLNLITYIENRRIQIPEELKPFFDICKDCIVEANLPSHFLDFRIEKSFISITFDISPILRLKLSGRLHYVLIPKTYISLISQSSPIPDSIKITQGTTSDGKDMMRVFLNNPDELRLFSWYIRSEYNTQLKRFKKRHNIIELDISD